MLQHRQLNTLRTTARSHAGSVSRQWAAWVSNTGRNVTAAPGHRIAVRTAQLDVQPSTLDVQPSTLSTPSAEAEQPAEQSGTFSWTKAWYPAAVVENMDVDKPNKFTLLGQDYVLWADAAGDWHCFTDRCPHRLATLSDGIVDRKAGEIVCAYHGWRFEGSGRCTSIPQALDATSQATACSSKRSCAASFPTAVKGGLLWVWPDTAPTAAADAAAADIPLVPELADESLLPLKGRFMVRDVPYSFDLFLENVLDPTHVDFAHHGVAGFDANKFKTLDLKLVEDRGPAGFVFQSLPSDKSRRGTFMHFVPPALVTLQPGPDPEDMRGSKALDAGNVRPGSENPEVLSGLIFYVYPTKPGWCRLAGTSWVSDRQGKPIKSLSLFAAGLPVFLKHLLSFEFFAGDDVFLGAASKALAEGGDWRRSYYCPTRADAAIIALRKWLDTYSGGKIPFPEHMQGPAAVLSNLDITRRQAMDRHSQHVQHCTHCKKALAKTQSVAAAALAAAVVAAAAACLAASLRATAALAPDAVPGWLLAAAGAGCQTFGLAAPLLALAAVAVGVHVVAKKLEQLFYFREFERPAF